MSRCDKSLHEMKLRCRWIVCLSCLLLFGTGFGAAQQPAGQRPPEVHARFSADTILIGDQFFLELDIDKDVAQEIRLPQFEDRRLMPQIEMLGIDRVDTLSREGRRIRLRVVYRLTGFDAGNFVVEGFPVVWTASAGDATDQKGDTILAPERLGIEVRTFDIDTTTYQLSDIKRPIHTPLVFAEIREMVYWSVAAAVLLAGIVYLLIRFLNRKKRRQGGQRSVPPHVAAIRALEKLHSRKLWQNGKHKEYYSQLANIVRIYIQGRYGIGAMEMTSDQLLEAMRDSNDERLREKLRELFALADLVKFAKMAPEPEDNEQAYFDAYFYIEETKEIPEPGQGQPLAPGATATEAGEMPAEDDLTISTAAVEPDKHRNEGKEVENDGDAV